MERRIGIGIALALLVATEALGATFTVDSTADEVDAAPGDGVCATVLGECTLRAAVDEANALVGGDAIDVPAGTFILGPELRVEDDVTISGAGANLTILDADLSKRVFRFDQGAAVVRDLTITGGATGSDSGGGVRVSTGAAAIFERVHITGNRSPGGVSCISGPFGSPIYCYFVYGGAGGIFSSGSTEIIDSTVSDNDGYTGGIHVSGGAFLVRNSTLTDLLRVGGTTAQILNSTLKTRLVANNSEESTQIFVRDSLISGGCDEENVSRIFSLGGNVENGTCGFGEPTDIDADPMLGILGLHGGSIPTVAPLIGSPAIDAGVIECPPADERGVARPQDGDQDDVAVCDPGAYEFRGTCTDADADGFFLDGGSCGGSADCDDTNAAIFPGAVEICNDIDDNCNGVADESVDEDEDGFDLLCGADCDDGNPEIHPGMVELCNSVDDDCDGLVDEDFPDIGQVCPVGACPFGGTVACDLAQTGTACLPEVDPRAVMTVPGNSEDGRFGSSISRAGDFNNDGHPEFIVGAEQTRFSGSSLGAAQVISGASGDILLAVTGDSSGSYFGHAVLGFSDLTGDAIPDFLVGAPEEDHGFPNAGSVYALSGADGSLIYRLDGSLNQEFFGSALGRLDDIDGDSVPEFVVGVPRYATEHNSIGRILIHSGADGAVLYQVTGEQASDRFGEIVDVMPDIDGDDISEILTGSVYRHRVVVLSGATGTIIHEIFYTLWNPTFGTSRAGLSDVDGDGIADFVVNQPPYCAFVYSGATGEEIYRICAEEGDYQFARYVSGTGDMDGDSYEDIAVSFYDGPYENAIPGSVRVYSGRSGLPLFAFRGDFPGEAFGDVAAPVGDLDLDGIPDLAIAAPGVDDNGYESGPLRIVSTYGLAKDLDADGYAICNDCDDARPQIHPGALEACNAVDDDCDGAADEGFAGLGEVCDSDACPASAINACAADGQSVECRVPAEVSELRRLDGDALNDEMGWAVDGVGDVNGDGFDDWIVGARLRAAGGTWRGSATVVSGANGATLLRFDGDADNDIFGHSVAGADDVNGDGVPDFLVGAPGSDANGIDSGMARVHSGADGSVLFAFAGSASHDEFGFAVAGAGDVNADGHADLVVGAHLGDYAQVFSGADGAVLHTWNGDGPIDEFGYAVAGAGDVDADGVDDVIVSARIDDYSGFLSGSVHVFSGQSGALIHRFDGVTLDVLGNAVAGVEDVNGDGHADVAVGVPGHDAAGVDSGSARIYSGLDGSILYAFHGRAAGDEFGYALGNAGDVDGDGVADLAVGGHLGGYARVHSGRTGALLFTVEGESAGIEFGGAVAGAGDVNGDGVDDVLVGAPYAAPNGPYSGSAFVYTYSRCEDFDCDGYGRAGASACDQKAPDCDDDAPGIHPGAAEVPDNGVDDDCDGFVDEAPPTCGAFPGVAAVPFGAWTAYAALFVVLVPGTMWRRRR